MSDAASRRPLAYCPYCGGSLERRRPAGDDRQRLVCEACGEVLYENPKIVVSAVVERAGKVLLARRAGVSRAGKWDLPGGFVELDETAEEALEREVMEEVGLPIRLHGVLGVFRETKGPYAPTLNIHFRATPLGEPRPTNEVSEVGWFGTGELPPAEDFAFENDLAALRRWKSLPSLEET